MKHLTVTNTDTTARDPSVATHIMTMALGSREPEFIRCLSNSEAAISEIDNKMFNKFSYIDEEGVPQTCPSDHVKNKYLYMFTEGAVNYINAYMEMINSRTEQEDNWKQKLSAVEHEESVEYLKNIVNKENINEVQLISLGAGHSAKEIELIKELLNRVSNGVKIKYYAVDVSAYLLQLGALDLESKLGDRKQVEFESIICDFWQLSDAVKSHRVLGDKERDGDHKTLRVFLLLGGTFGNYYEADLVDRLVSAMRDGDRFLVGADIWYNGPIYTGEKKQDKTDTEKAITYVALQEKEVLDIYKYYNTLTNLQWLLQPLRHIPHYAGYLTRYRNFAFDMKDSIFTSDETNDTKKSEMEFLTDVPESICYAPAIKIYTEILEKIPDGKYKRLQESKTIRLATSTKYNGHYLEQWFKSYIFEDRSASVQYRFKNVQKKGDFGKAKLFTMTVDSAGHAGLGAMGHE